MSAAQTSVWPSPACMGGWCVYRLGCGLHVQANRMDPQPAERLCRRGRETPTPIAAVRQARVIGVNFVEVRHAA